MKNRVDTFYRLLLLLVITSTSYSQTQISGPIINSTVWDSLGSPYIIESPTIVLSGAVLTIEPGVDVQFEDNSSLTIGDGATLRAQGSALYPIQFSVTENLTSFGGIELSQGFVGSTTIDDTVYVTGSLFDHCIFGSTTQTNNIGALVRIISPTDTLLISNTNFSESNGFYSLLEGSSSISLVNCTFENNITTGPMILNFGDYIFVYRSTFINNSPSDEFSSNAKIIWLFHPFSVQLINSVFINNVGCIITAPMINNGTFSVENSSFISNNNSFGDYSCINQYQDDRYDRVYPHFKNTQFRDNIAGSGSITRSNTYNAPIIMENCSFINNRGRHGAAFFSGPELLIDSSKFRYNYATDIGGAAWVGIWDSSKILNSEFTDNSSESDGGALYYSGEGRSVIEHSNFFNNSTVLGSGAAIYSYFSTEVHLDSCSVINNSILSPGNIGNPRAILAGGAFSGNNNNLANNESDFIIRMPGWGTATNNNENNFWGLTDSSGIAEIIYDLYDDPNFNTQLVDFTPFLVSPVAELGLMPVSGLNITEIDNNYAIISWDTSLSPNVSGYMVYYSTDTPMAPYDNSINVGNVTSYTLSGLNLGTEYFIAVTVYDTDGNESWYSNEVTGLTRVLEVQNLDVAVDEELHHITDHIPPITFDYYDSMGESQTQYHVQVSTIDDFSVLDMWDSGTENSNATAIQYLGNPLLDGATYYLRVRVASGAFWSEWSNLSFRMNSTPSTPILVNPIENLVVDEPIQLLITNSSDAEMDPVQYQYFVFDDNSREVFIDSSQWISDTTWQLSVSLSDNNQYWWYARSYDGYEMSDLAIASSFLVNTENNPPGIFNLTYPEQNGVTTSLQPVFSWTNSIDPDPIDTVSYTMIVDSPAPGIMTFNVGNNTSWELPELLTDNTEYFWKVVATDLLGFETENTGGYFGFTTNQVNENPAVVELYSPDSVMVLSLSPQMVWSPAIDPDPNDIVSYELHWWGESVEHDSILTDTNIVTLPHELQDNMQYFWEVIAMDQTDGISHSEPATFWTDLVPEAPEGFALLSPENDAAGLSNMPSFQWEIAEDPDPMDYATYTLQIATDSSFSEVVFETNTNVEAGLELTESLPTDTEYWWKVVATDSDSLTTESEIFKFTVGYVSIAEDIALPTEYMLDQNYPNPFNPSTTIRYGLPVDSNISLVIYDVRGQVVQTLESAHQSAGWYDVVWNGETADGKTISTGIYFARLVAGEYSQVIKMLYLK